MRNDQHHQRAPHGPARRRRAIEPVRVFPAHPGQPDMASQHRRAPGHQDQDQQRRARGHGDEVCNNQRQKPERGDHAAGSPPIPRKRPNVSRQEQRQRQRPSQRAGARFVAQEIGCGQERRAADGGKHPPLPAGLPHVASALCADLGRKNPPSPASAARSAARFFSLSSTSLWRRGPGRGGFLLTGRRSRGAAEESRPASAQGQKADERPANRPNPVLQSQIREWLHQERISQQSRQSARVGPGINGEVAPIHLFLVQQWRCAKQARRQSGVGQQRGQRLQFQREPGQRRQRRSQRQETAQTQRGQNSISDLRIRLAEPPASKIGAQHSQLKEKHRATPDRGRPAKLRQQPFARHQLPLKGQARRRRGDKFFIFHFHRKPAPPVSTPSPPLSNAE